jgi:cellulose synthase (UDP-forming)
VMALGIAPEEVGAFLVQRGRWAKGSLQMLRRDPPMLKRGLSWAQRIEYTSSCVHFLEGPQRLLGFLIPPIVLVAGVAPIDAGPLLYAALFIPQVVLVPLASWALTRGLYRPLEGERYAVARMTPYLRGMSALVGGRGAFTVTPKGGRSARTGVARALWLPVSLAALTVAALGYQTAAQVLVLPGQLSPGAHAVTVLWAAANVALVASVAAWASDVRHVRFSHRFPVALEAAYAAEGGPTTSPARVEDLSREGLAAVVSEPRSVGERLRIVLLLDDGPIEVRGVVVRAELGFDGATWSLGVGFEHLEPRVADAIVEWCFRHPFGPGRPLRVAELEPLPRRAPARVAAPAAEPAKA